MTIIALEQRPKVYACLRYLIYFVLTVGVAQLIRSLSAIYLDKTFVEFGIVENVQIALVLLSALSFGVQVMCSQKDRALLLFFASLCGFAFIRELDHYFECLMPCISWKFAVLLPLGAGAYLLYDRKQALKSVMAFIGTPAFSLMTMMMFIFIAVAQVIGNKQLISNVLVYEQLDVSLARRFIEESVELIAYFVLFLSSIEFHFSMKRQD